MKVEVAVVGRGMIGSAAARYLAEAGRTVALIGAGEPDDYTASDRPFASHYDEARITRISAAGEIWADLAVRSIERYSDIASRSGISFHSPIGLVTASSNATAAVQIAQDRGANARLVDQAWVRRTTGIELPNHDHVTLLHEDAPAGLIRPRRLVAAQVQLAQRAGAAIVDEPATGVTAAGTSMLIETAHGRVEADTMILATGAYGAALTGHSLAIERRLRTVLHVEVESALALPSLIVEQPDRPDLDRLYWTPPVRYVDGRLRLKVGASVLPLEIAQNEADIAAWFAAGGSAAEATSLLDAVRSLLPDASIGDSVHQPCVMAYTSTEHPFVGRIDDRVVVALGGNGSGAKGSDELGRLAALVATDQGDPLLDQLQPVLVT